jgi:hypothetical protein
MLKTFVNTVDGRIMVLEKCLEMPIKTAYGIVGAKTIGHGKDSTLGLLYNFIKETITIISLNTIRKQEYLK